MSPISCKEEVDGLRRLAVQKASWRMYSWLRNLEQNQKSARVRHVRRYRDCNLVYGLASYPEGTVICKAAEQESVEQGLFLQRGGLRVHAWRAGARVSSAIFVLNEETMAERTEIICCVGCLLKLSLFCEFEPNKLDEAEHVFESVREGRIRTSQV